MLRLLPSIDRRAVPVATTVAVAEAQSPSDVLWRLRAGPTYRKPKAVEGTGASNREIADRLSLAEGTVKKHVAGGTRKAFPTVTGPDSN